jgi:hypothetical protein
VLVRNVFQHSRQAGWVFDVLRIGIDRTRQRLLLALLLMGHVEHILQFRVSFKQALIEALMILWPCWASTGAVAFTMSFVFCVSIAGLLCKIVDMFGRSSLGGEMPHGPSMLI